MLTSIVYFINDISACYPVIYAACYWESETELINSLVAVQEKPLYTFIVVYQYHFVKAIPNTNLVIVLLELISPML